MKNKSKPNRGEETKLFSGILWLNAKAMGLVMGIVVGLALFIATMWLVIKDGESPGPHLALLSQYFIGYEVSFLGSFVGLAYGFAVGSLGGSFIGWIYNRIAALRNGSG